MTNPPPRARRLAQAAVTALAAALVVPAAASALTVSKAELRDGQLRVEGSTTFPLSGVTASSSTSTAFARPDTKGRFKLEASGFRSDDCTAIVSDGFTPIVVSTLSGCTPVAPTPVGENPPPTGACTIDAPAPATFHVGAESTQAFTTTGCSTSLSPVQWTLVAGRIPPGMGSPIAQGQTAGEITGVPVTEGTYVFTLRVTDSIGATDQETFTTTILPPRRLTVSTSAILPPASAGQGGYAVPLRADGGLPGYDWSVVAGTLPIGMRVAQNTLAGFPTETGTFSFTLRVTDSRGTTADEPMTLTVVP